MERPVNNDNIDERLDILLKKAAERNVKVRILHWQEHPAAGLANNSEYTKKHLESLNPNIKV